MAILTVGIDLAKNVFAVHGVDETGKAVLVRPEVPRAKLMELIANLAPCLIGMEACSGAHHWAREFAQFGHTVRLMAPKFVVPYRMSGKRGKNDAADAAAICEAVTRPNMRFVPVKSVEQQSQLFVHRARQGYVEQRTALINRIRGLLSELGIVLPLKAALHDAGLSLPADLPEQWVVDCKAVGDGQAALRYLGRYLYRGVIAEQDILRCKDGMVTFRYCDAQTGKSATRTLPGADFLWLLLQHVLPKGFQRARNFGFLHHNCRRTLRLLQLSHRAPTQAAVPPPAPERPVWLCIYGQPMVILRRRVRHQPVPPCSAPQTLRPDKTDPLEPARD